MSVWVDRKFIESLSFRLERFKKTGNVYRFRCPECGDSQKNKSKTRGYFYQIGEVYNFMCHNCGASTSFANFLKRFDSNLYSEYLYESLKERGASPQTLERVAPKAPVEENPFEGLQRLSDLPSNHFARRYIVERKIPTKYLEKFYFAPAFRAFVNSKIPGKFANTARDEARVIIPIATKLGVIGFQGRALDRDNPIRYITVLLQDDMPRIWGMDTVDFNSRFYVLEGPLDACFLHNAIAICGSDLTSTLRRVQASQRLAVIVYDNEPRSGVIIEKMLQAVRDGWKVIVWPNNIKEKDINDMILAGLTPWKIMDVNAHEGLSAQIAIMNWRKV